jgi:hypothetical protein
MLRSIEVDEVRCVWNDQYFYNWDVDQVLLQLLAVGAASRNAGVA